MTCWPSRMQALLCVQHLGAAAQQDKVCAQVSCLLPVRRLGHKAWPDRGLATCWGVRHAPPVGTVHREMVCCVEVGLGSQQEGFRVGGGVGLILPHLRRV